MLLDFANTEDYFGNFDFAFSAVAFLVLPA
jgi:hypothetical protein